MTQLMTLLPNESLGFDLLVIVNVSTTVCPQSEGRQCVSN